MLHFIVDGYNLINKIPEFKNLLLGSKRKRLVSLLEDFKYEISARNKITVVFDGKKDIYYRPTTDSKISVLFSKDEDADSLIKKMTDKAEHSNSLVIVTDDRALAKYVKSCGARHKSTHSFLEEIAKKKNRPLQDYNFKVGFKDAYKISKELQDLWNEKYS